MIALTLFISDYDPNARENIQKSSSVISLSRFRSYNEVIKFITLFCSEAFCEHKEIGEGDETIAVEVRVRWWRRLFHENIRGEHKIPFRVHYSEEWSMSRRTGKIFPVFIERSAVIERRNAIIVKSDACGFHAIEALTELQLAVWRHAHLYLAQAV